MSLDENKAYILHLIAQYTGRFWTHHRKRATNLHRFIRGARSTTEICIRLINEDCLFNLGYSISNTYANDRFERKIVNSGAKGKYYSSVIQPALSHLIREAEQNNTSSQNIELASSNHEKVLVYSNKSAYIQGLERFLTGKNIAYMQITNANEWLRDVFYVGKKSLQGVVRPYLYVRDKKFKWKKQGTSNPPIEEANISRVQYHLSSEHNYLRQNYYDGKTFIANSSVETGNLGSLLIDSNSIHSTLRQLEGGNLFEAINHQGEKFYFIGVNALLNEIDVDNYRRGVDPRHRPNPSALDQDYIYHQCSLILEKYKKIFQTSNVIMLPQWTYHLDLQMSYIGKSVFMVHKFSQVVDKLKTMTLNGDINEVRYYAGQNEPKQIDGIVNYILLILKACKFTAIDYAGSFYKRHPAGNERYLKPRYSNGQGLSSFFTNGIDLYDPINRKYYYLTVDSPYPQHKRYFTSILSDYGIQAVFLNINELGSAQTVHQISEKSGALRCQTNFIPMDFINRSNIQNLSSRRTSGP